MPTGKHQTKSPAPLRRSQRNAARATLSQAESPASIDAHLASIGRKAGNPPKAAISPDLDGPPSRKAVPGRTPRPPGRELIEIADRQVAHDPPAPPGDCEPHPVAHDPPAPPKDDQPAARRKAPRNDPLEDWHLEQALEDSRRDAARRATGPLSDEDVVTDDSDADDDGERRAPEPKEPALRRSHALDAKGLSAEAAAHVQAVIDNLRSDARGRSRQACFGSVLRDHGPEGPPGLMGRADNFEPRPTEGGGRIHKTTTRECTCASTMTDPSTCSQHCTRLRA